jgi:hypothetical protein
MVFNFSHSVVCFFILLTVYFPEQKIFLLSFHFTSLFLLLLPLFWWHIQKKKSLSRPISRRFFPMVSSRSFMAFNTFQNFFCTWCEIGVQFHLSTCEHPVFLTPFVEGTILSLKCFLDSCWRLTDCRYMDLFLGSLFLFIGLCVCYYTSTIWF